MTPAVLAPADRLLAAVRLAYDAGVRDLAPLAHPDPALDARRTVLALDAAVRRLVRDRRERLAAQNLLAELRLRQERAIGRWLAAHVRHAGGGDRRSRSAAGTVVGDLPDGVSKNESSRFQRLAAVPDAAIDRYLSDARDAGREITTAAALRLLPPPAAARTTPPAAGTAKPPAATDLQTLLAGGETFGAVYLDPPARADPAAVPVGRLARPDAAVFLWAAGGRVGKAEALVRGWGFTARGVLVATAAPVAGTHWRLAAEVLLVGTRGRGTLRERGRLSRPAGRRGEAVTQADAAHSLVERLGPGPYLDVYAPTPSAGWVVGVAGGQAAEARAAAKRSRSAPANPACGTDSRTWPVS